MRARRAALVIVLALASSACVSAINRANAEKYYAWGQLSEEDGSFGAAQERYRRAYLNMLTGDVTPRARAAIVHRLGRMHGFRCDLPGAARLLAEAHALDPDVGADRMGLRLIELAEVSALLGQHAESAQFYRQALAVLEPAGLALADPATLVSLLIAQAEEMEATGSAANDLRERAAAVRAASPATPSALPLISYREACVAKDDLPRSLALVATAAEGWDALRAVPVAGGGTVTVVLDDRRSQVIDQRVVDLPFMSAPGMRSTLHPALTTTQFDALARQVASHSGVAAGGVVRITIEVARQEFVAGDFHETERAETTILVDVVGHGGPSRGVCLDEESSFDADEDSIAARFDRSLACAVDDAFTGLEQAVAQ